MSLSFSVNHSHKISLKNVTKMINSFYGKYCLLSSWIRYFIQVGSADAQFQINSYSKSFFPMQKCEQPIELTLSQPVNEKPLTRRCSDLRENYLLHKNATVR